MSDWIQKRTKILPSPEKKPPRAFHVLAKPTGPICNLDCKYCFYLEKEILYPDAHSWAMNDVLLESFIRQYIEAQEVPTVSFTWQGGEPTLLGIDFFRKVTRLQSEYGNGKQIQNAFQTNGVLLDDEWCEFLAKEGFLVGLSIDGPPEFHDHYRVDKGGLPSFDRVIRGRNYLIKHGVEFNTLTCVQRHNSGYPLEIYRFLKEIGQGFMQFIPIVERVAEESENDGLTLIGADSAMRATVSDWSVEPLSYGRFLTAIFDEWVLNDVGRTYVQIFDVALEAWSGMDPSLCVFRETCGSALAIEHNGDLYSCDHFVYPNNKLGNIIDSPMETLISLPAQKAFGQNKHDKLPSFCRRCEVRFACNGECPKHRFTRTPDGEAGLNYLCAGYKHFFSHIDPAMRFMANELRHHRPPANVMHWVRMNDLRPQRKGRPGRNDPCTCGSGKKFKKCCMR